jgi:transglutaminase-like putative cysteine protease
MLVWKDNDKLLKLHERDAQLTYTHQVMNFGPGKIKTLDIYIAIPVNRDNQQILSINFKPKPTDFVTDRWGLKTAHFHYNNVPAGKKVEANMIVKAKMWDVYYFIYPDKVGTLADIPQQIKKKYLVDEAKYQYHSPIIQNAVKQAVGNEQNVYWIVRKIFDYVRKHMYYQMSGGWNTAPTVLARGNGSCSEYSFVFISMCRAAGVPARYVGSVAERGEAASTDDVFHRWVEVYMPNYGWIPVDPSGGDAKLPADQARGFGHLSRRFLITTQNGGGSKTMGWTYNSNAFFTTHPQTYVVQESYGDWQPIEK